MKTILPIAVASFLSTACLYPVFASNAEDAQQAVEPVEISSSPASVQEAAKAATLQANESMQQISRASKIIGTAVTNPNGDNLGSITDLIIDPNTATVAYAVVSYGGTMGIGSKLFGMPWKAMLWNQEKTNYVINVDAATLIKSPGFDATKWPNSMSEFDQLGQQTAKP